MTNELLLADGSWPHKRLSSDAAIVLRNAGYIARHGNYHNGKAQTLFVEAAFLPLTRLPILFGCVNNTVVEQLLKDKR